MIRLQPIATVKDSAALMKLIPEELLALADGRGPWTSYVAIAAHEVVVGACAFKGGPTTMKEVEIAYLTFPEHEGHGHATAMARSLLEIAAQSGEVERVIAHTLRAENASVRICRRLGFVLDGEVLDPTDGPVWRWKKPV